MDLLEQCEIDDEKLMGKCTRQRGPKVFDFYISLCREVVWEFKVGSLVS